jgi:hypothetical protein
VNEVVNVSPADQSSPMGAKFAPRDQRLPMGPSSTLGANSLCLKMSFANLKQVTELDRYHGDGTGWIAFSVISSPIIQVRVKGRTCTKALFWALVVNVKRKQSG